MEFGPRVKGQSSQSPSTTNDLISSIGDALKLRGYRIETIKHGKSAPLSLGCRLSKQYAIELFLDSLAGNCGIEKFLLIAWCWKRARTVAAHEAMLSDWKRLQQAIREITLGELGFSEVSWLSPEEVDKLTSRRRSTA
ncbi:MAG TPA: hypothetical protein VLZ81_05175 [Blastocatellia bacterium]|nr:hypothetical protein [Blastocatellia bacterium]